jgi:hypothetical protein
LEEETKSITPMEIPHPSSNNSSSPHNAADFGNVRNDAEVFGSLPNRSEEFGTILQPSETFGSVRNPAEKTEHHTLTVREVARLFEQAGVPRTERSIVNWCQPNRQGIARLDAYYDSNERRYLITPQSVHRAIQEEQAKQATSGNANISETELPKASASGAEPSSRKDTSNNENLRELELQNRDLEITNRFKDKYIEKLESERGQQIQQLIEMSRHVGELQTQVLQLGGTPRSNRSLPNGSERDGNTASDIGATTY